MKYLFDTWVTLQVIEWYNDKKCSALLLLEIRRHKEGLKGKLIIEMLSIGRET